MKNFVLKNGRIFSENGNAKLEKLDIYVEAGKIKEIAQSIEKDVEVIDVNNAIISAGFIDVHTHCYKFGPIGTEADKLGIERGATTIFDAGTAGPLNIEDFKNNDIKESKTKIYSILNASSKGLETLSELKDIKNINEEAIEKAIENNRDIILGLKARASSSVVGELGIEPIKKAKELSRKFKLPLVVHLGNYPPTLEEVIELLDEGDIATHAFHGKPNGILTQEGKVKDVVIKAKERGVLFDIGHGSESFSFKVFKQALNEGFKPDLISTDLYYKNMNGPVYNLANVLTKVVNCGLEFEKAIEMVTRVPAEIFGLNNVGSIEIGKAADFSIIEVVDSKDTLVDSKGDELKINNKINSIMTIVSKGDYSEVFRHITE